MLSDRGSQETTTATECFGVIRAGEHGLATDVINVNTGTKDYDKKKNHADMAPFFFRLVASAGSTQGILAVQRLGQAGVKGILTALIRDEFIKSYPDFRIEFQQLVPDYVMKQFAKQGKPKSVKFIKRSIPKDISDIVAGKKVDTEGRIEITISTGDEKFFRLPQLMQAVKSNAGIASIYALSDLNSFEPDETRIVLDIGGGRSRTINFNNLGKLKASFDITQEVTADATGYPSLKSVTAAADKIVKELALAAKIVI